MSQIFQPFDLLNIQHKNRKMVIKIIIFKNIDSKKQFEVITNMRKKETYLKKHPHELPFHANTI